MPNKLASQQGAVANKTTQPSKYRIWSQIGQGQFGRVFCAHIRPTGLLVAIKELSHQNAPTNKFLRELWSLMTLRHPAIVSCLALEHTANSRYLVMEYCEGGTLRQLMEQENALKLGEALQLIIGILSGLEYTHRQGILHCDIKPDNILLTLENGSWQPKISDFGLAIRLPYTKDSEVHEKLSHDLVMGTPAYMAPERFYGLYSPVSDLYAVGIILFELLTGYRPFIGVPRHLMWAHLNARLEIPSILPEPLQVILKHSLEKLPARRYKSAVTMANALREILDDPAIKPFKNYLLPLGKNSDVIHLKLLPEVKRQPISITLNYLSCYGQVICGAGDGGVLLWLGLSKLPIKIGFSEPICDIKLTRQGCFVKCLNSIYWLNRLDWHPQKILELQSNYHATIERDGEWLAVAEQNIIKIYSLTNTRYFLRKIQVINLAKEETFRYLWFLDQRHFMVVCENQIDKFTLFKIYNRRGQYLTSIKLPVLFERLIFGDLPYTLLGIERESKKTGFSIHLKPYQVTRFFLEKVPYFVCSYSQGWVLTDTQGKIMLLDRHGQSLGYLNAPKSATALASWGNQGLVLANSTEDKNYLYAFEIDVQEAIKQKEEQNSLKYQGS